MPTNTGDGFPPGGDGLLSIETYQQFKEVLDKISDLSWTGEEGPVTYEVVVKLFGGVEGRFKGITIPIKFFSPPEEPGFYAKATS